MRRWLLVAAALVVVAACSGSDDDEPAARFSLDVRPRTSAFDEPLSVVVHGVPAGARAEVEVTSTDANGVEWSSRATFAADDRGDVDVARASAVDGSYSGVQPLGLVESMEPASPAFYRWGPDTRPFRFRASARGRRAVAVTVDRRFGAPGVRVAETDQSVDGFVGELWSPPGQGRSPAALLLGGSEGGLTGPRTLAAALASNGVPALGVAYFGLPGLPPRLESIPLEYFDTALEWLRRQPGVDPERVTVLGASRGSEAAMLVADHFHASVHAAVGLSPSNVAVCSYPGCAGAAWTLGGQPVPFTRQFNEPQPTDVPDAVLPVDGIDGPVLLACGGQDLMWVSCNYARALDGRLDDAHPEAHHDVLSYPKAGHSVAFVLPGVPGLAAADRQGGGELGVTRAARADLWPQVLDFVRDGR